MCTCALSGSGKDWLPKIASLQKKDGDAYGWVKLWHGYWMLMGHLRSARWTSQQWSWPTRAPSFQCELLAFFFPPIPKERIETGHLNFVDLLIGSPQIKTQVPEGVENRAMSGASGWLDGLDEAFLSLLVPTCANNGLVTSWDDAAVVSSNGSGLGSSQPRAH